MPCLQAAKSLCRAAGCLQRESELEMLKFICFLLFNLQFQQPLCSSIRSPSVPSDRAAMSSTLETSTGNSFPFFPPHPSPLGKFEIRLVGLTQPPGYL